MLETANPRPKMYGYLMDDGNVERKGKGIRRPVLKNKIRYEDYRDCVLNPDEYAKRNIVKSDGFRSFGHTVFTETTTKIGLTLEDDKRVILADKIHFLAYCHYRLRNMSDDDLWYRRKESER